MRTPLTALLLFVLLAGCAGPAAAPQPTSAPQQTLTVFAAASLADAFAEIGKNFEAANPGVTIRFNFAGSQTLRAQIEQGAQADGFAPASLKEMEALRQANFIEDGAAQIFAGNSLVVIVPAENPAGLQSLAGLGKAGVKVVLASPEVPVGGYTRQLLANLEAVEGSGYPERVLANVVSYENDVRQVLAKVQLGEADAGVVYRSDARAAPTVLILEIPAASNVRASYPIAALNQSSNPALAQAFIAYVLSVEGQNSLASWGFESVP